MVGPIHKLGTIVVNRICSKHVFTSKTDHEFTRDPLTVVEVNKTSLFV